MLYNVIFWGILTSFFSIIHSQIKKSEYFFILIRLFWSKPNNLINLIWQYSTWSSFRVKSCQNICDFSFNSFHNSNHLLSHFDSFLETVRLETNNKKPYLPKLSRRPGQISHHHQKIKKSPQKCFMNNLSTEWVAI